MFSSVGLDALEKKQLHDTVWNQSQKAVLRSTALSILYPRSTTKRNGDSIYVKLRFAYPTFFCFHIPSVSYALIQKPHSDLLILHSRRSYLNLSDSSYPPEGEIYAYSINGKLEA
jgi:hypothetical protein